MFKNKIKLKKKKERLVTNGDAHKSISFPPSPAFVFLSSNWMEEVQGYKGWEET